jgi:hypothetical protein
MDLQQRIILGNYVMKEGHYLSAADRFRRTIYTTDDSQLDRNMLYELQETEKR